jgi:hypothetical protein
VSLTNKEIIHYFTRLLHSTFFFQPQLACRLGHVVIVGAIAILAVAAYFAFAAVNAIIALVAVVAVIHCGLICNSSNFCCRSNAAFFLFTAVFFFLPGSG